MQVNHVKFLRRSMIGLIIVVLLAVALNYLHTLRSRAHIIKQAAQVLSSDMLRSAESIEYSKYENGTVRFKIRAERLLETRQGKSLLQGIEAFAWNPDGSISNQIRSRRAEYDSDHKLVDFSGDVRLDIGEDVEVRTNSLHYDLNTNVGSTDDRIRFASKQAQGTARGVRYNQAQKSLDLNGDLDFTITRPVTKQDGSVQTEHVRARSSRGYYSRGEGIFRFEGNAHLDSESSSLSGDTIEARFSEDQKHLSSLICEGNVIYQSKDAQEARTLQGDRMTFGIGQDNGSLQSIDVLGHGSFASKTPMAEQALRGSTIHMEIEPTAGLPKQVLSDGGVEFRMKREAEETVMTGEKLNASFVAGTNLLREIDVQQRARMLTSRSQDAGQDELSAEEIRLSFRETQGRSTLNELKADRSVRFNSTPAKKAGNARSEPSRSLSATSLTVLYSKAGDYFESGMAAGNVVLSGIPLGEAGHPEIRRLLADTVQFHFFPGNNRLKDFDGDGHIQVFYQKPADPATEAPAQEFRTSSSKMRATFKEADGTAQEVSQWGDFQYQDASRTANSGRSDYDALKEILVLRESPRISDPNGTTAGDLVEYDRKQKILSVRQHVRSIMKPKDNNQGRPFTNAFGSSAPGIITAEEMKYWTDESRARFTGDVQLLSESGQLQAKVLEILNGEEQVEAQGNVRHLIPRKEAGEEAKPSTKKEASATKPEKDLQRVPILIRSSKMRYSKAENSIHYLGNVNLTSADMEMSAESLDVILDKEGKQIERATAKGKVAIHQAGREVKGDTADYYLVAGKLVVSGNPAEVRDPAHGKSLARRLTFFTTDDRIVLENP